MGLVMSRKFELCSLPQTGDKPGLSTALPAPLHCPALAVVTLDHFFGNATVASSLHPKTESHLPTEKSKAGPTPGWLKLCPFLAHPEGEQQMPPGVRIG